MRKLLVLAVFGLMFAVSSLASDVGVYTPDVGIEQSITYAQPVTIMPALVSDYQCVRFAPVNTAEVIIRSGTAIYYLAKGKTPNVVLTPYHNPDYGLCNSKNIFVNTTKIKVRPDVAIYSVTSITTTRHVFCFYI